MNWCPRNTGQNRATCRNKMHHCTHELRSPLDLTPKSNIASRADTTKSTSPNDLLKKLNLTDEFLEMLSTGISKRDEVAKEATSNKAEQRRRRKNGKKPTRTSESMTGESSKRRRKPKEDRRQGNLPMESLPSRSQLIMNQIRDEALQELGEPIPLADLACMVLLRNFPTRDPDN